VEKEHHALTEAIAAQHAADDEMRELLSGAEDDGEEITALLNAGAKEESEEIRARLKVAQAALPRDKSRCRLGV